MAAKSTKNETSTKPVLLGGRQPADSEGRWRRPGAGLHRRHAGAGRETSDAGFTKYIKITFLEGTSLRPIPPPGHRQRLVTISPAHSPGHITPRLSLMDIRMGNGQPRAGGDAASARSAHSL